ncbi:hypothetical protein E1160_16575 [Rhodospirillaceae bacterium RKSG073]|nr:hypothetical protein [Curvivirga aplysinae]
MSIAMNFVLSSISIGREVTKRRKLLVLLASLTLNLGVLIYFKYTLLDINPLTISRDFNTATEIILPLGISFYTFQQISYQIDCYWGKIKEINIKYYLLYVSFFPQLVAGPIVNYLDMAPQYKNLEKHQVNWNVAYVFIALFTIGLFKKVAIADQLGKSVDRVYASVSSGAPLAFLDAWAAAIAFPLQIYFDFSGYSDMACALAILLGLKLPLNFHIGY